MKETGIIMSGCHPVDILEGRKTMTRRTQGLEKINEDPGLWKEPFYDEVTGYWNFWQVYTGDVLSAKCPYGGSGDRLRVRETHFIGGIKSDEWVKYRADGERPNLVWRPSIFMPRWASRILLEIKEVRAERLQEITPDDAVAEGAGSLHNDCMKSAIANYQTIWDSLNAKRGYGWEVNPFVWVISFGKER